MVVGHGPLALLLGDRRVGGRVRTGEHDLGAGIEQRGRAVALRGRVMPGVDPADVHGALGAGLLGAQHDRVAQPDLLRDGERGHVAQLGVAVELGAGAGQHAREVLHVLDGTEEVAEVGAVGLVAGEVQEGRVRELLGDRGHRVHVAERGADDEVEALAREAPEDLLRVCALGHELHVRDMGVRHVLAEVLETLVVGLAPAAVVVGSDEDHRDVELALHRLGDGDRVAGSARGAVVRDRRGRGARGLRRRHSWRSPSRRSRQPRSGTRASPICYGSCLLLLLWGRVLGLPCTPHSSARHGSAYRTPRIRPWVGGDGIPPGIDSVAAGPPSVGSAEAIGVGGRT